MQAFGCTLGYDFKLGNDVFPLLTIVMLRFLNMKRFCM